MSDLPSMVGEDAGESDGIMKLHQDSESVVECHSRHRRFSARVSGNRVGPGEGLDSLSGESEGIIGLLEVSESDVSLHSRIHGSSLARTCAGVGECGVGVSGCGAGVRVFAGFVVRCSVGLPAVCALTFAQVALGRWLVHVIRVVLQGTQVYWWFVACVQIHQLQLGGG